MRPAGDPSIDLILGVSSVGKSSYISRRLSSSSRPVILAYELQKADPHIALDGQDCTVHYNMLLPWHNDADAFGAPIGAEPAFAALLERKSRLSATVLIARPAEVAKRILLRDDSEPELRQNTGNYPAEAIFDFVSRIPLSAIYDVWFDFLSEHQIPFEILWAKDWGYPPVSTPADAKAILQSRSNAAYTSAERIKALAKFPCAYQTLDHTSDPEKGLADRSATLEAITPFLLGRSVLDVGCAEGFFCFGLERLGFTEVIGTEIKKDRFLAACAAKTVTGSQCEFMFRDVLCEPFARAFDTVLLLNVLHHATDPIAALRQAARLCTQRLIVEFATLGDAKFAQTCPHPPPRDTAMPLIGVSLLAGQDQTFLFAPEALRRICLDHDRLFDTIDFLPSPMSAGRSIAICTK